MIFRAKFAKNACFELFARCGVPSVHLTRKNSVLRVFHRIFQRNIGIENYIKFEAELVAA